METRILVAIEEAYRAYREVLAAGIKVLRPDIDVRTAVPSDIEEKWTSFDPQVIICSAVVPMKEDDRVTWITLPTDPSKPTEVRLVGGRRFSQSNPTFTELLDIIDEAVRLANDGRRSPGGERPRTNAPP